MTVKELIKELRKYDDDFKVKIFESGRWGCPCDITEIKYVTQHNDESLVLIDIFSEGT